MDDYTFSCTRCGYGEVDEIVGTFPGGHHGKLICGSCGCFVKWIPKPKNENKSRREVSKKLVQKFSQGFCEVCLRHSGELPLPQVLEGHHIIPVEHGGSDDQENIQIVCTACHRLIHYQRTYLGHYSNNADQEGVA